MPWCTISNITLSIQNDTCMPESTLHNTLSPESIQNGDIKKNKYHTSHYEVIVTLMTGKMIKDNPSPRSNKMAKDEKYHIEKL